jgi:L,D-peptidoglycan transpeptidase YkuD (ErfK/YbiS/YcfS/YnhG family)
VIRCALGPAGVVHQKREGDGATPAGRFRLAAALVRGDRIGRPATPLPSRRLTERDGWCDDMRHALYNRPVRRPFGASHEALWRDDHLYDCIVVIDYNIGTVLKGRGSAIFLHVAAHGLTPTAGCVAIPRPALIRLLPRLSRTTQMVIR